MDILKNKISQNIESIISNNLHGCTVYKHEFNPGQQFDCEYILEKNNQPKVSVCYSVFVDSIKVLLFKFLTAQSGIYSKTYNIGFFDTNKLEQVITAGFEQIQF